MKCAPGIATANSFPVDSGIEEGSVTKSTPKRSSSSPIAAFDRIGIGKRGRVYPDCEFPYSSPAFPNVSATQCKV